MSQEKVITKEKCEEMLDKEAERVAKSILQLVNSITFDPSQLDKKEKELIYFANKVTYAVKKVINTEVEKNFNL